MKTWSTFTQVGSVLLVMGIFFVVGLVASQQKEFLEIVVSTSGAFGMIAYVAITALAVLAAPLSTFPLVPIAAVMWGSLVGALLSALGWLIGATLVYLIVGNYRRTYIHNSTFFSRAEEIGSVVTKRNDPLTLIFLRMILPVDVLSYALALFVPMPFFRYFWTTALGILPFAFIFSYIANLGIFYQTVALGGVAVFLLVSYVRLRSWYNDTHL